MGGTFGTRTKSSVFLKKISEVHLKKVNLEVTSFWNCFFVNAFPRKKG